MGKPSFGQTVRPRRRFEALGQSVEDQLPHGDIQKVYYYDIASPRVWASNEEAQKALEEHGTLLWTAEDGVVYNP